MHFLTSILSLRCYKLPYKEYSTWENLEFYLMLISLAILYAGCVGYPAYPKMVNCNYLFIECITLYLPQIIT